MKAELPALTEDTSSIRWRLVRPGALKLAKASFTLCALLAMAIAVLASRDYLVGVLASIKVATPRRR